MAARAPTLTPTFFGFGMVKKMALARTHRLLRACFTTLPPFLELLLLTPFLPCLMTLAVAFVIMLRRPSNFGPD